MTELKVTIKGQERKKLIDTYMIDRLVDEPVVMERGNATLEKYVKILLDEFKGEPQDIVITCTMVYR